MARQKNSINDLMKFVDKNGPEIYEGLGNCWLWTRSVNKKGYGQIRIDYHMWATHRLSYQLHIGDFDKNLFVCHKCDNPTCVNPDHLFLGTTTDNMRDMLKKGRAPRKGEKCASHILTSDDVVQIKRSHPKKSVKILATQYGVGYHTIYAILTGKNWSHL